MPLGKRWISKPQGLLSAARCAFPWLTTLTALEWMAKQMSTAPFWCAMAGLEIWMASPMER